MPVESDVSNATVRLVSAGNFRFNVRLGFNLTSGHTSAQLTLTRQEWISVLKLSTMWEFTKIRKWAIDELSKMKTEMGDMGMIECGRNFDVKEWWLEGYVGLLNRGETITDEEAERLGWKIAARLLRLRERFAFTRCLAVGEFCTLCNRTGLLQNVRCARCAGYGVGVTGITPSWQSNVRESIPEAVEKEFQTEV